MGNPRGFPWPGRGPLNRARFRRSFLGAWQDAVRRRGRGGRHGDVRRRRRLTAWFTDAEIEKVRLEAARHGMAPAAWLAKLGTDAAGAAGGGEAAAVPWPGPRPTRSRTCRTRPRWPASIGYLFNQAVAEAALAPASTPPALRPPRRRGPRGAPDGGRDAEGRPGTAAMIGRVLPRGENVRGVLHYLYGKGKQNQHVNPHLVAGWIHPAGLEPPPRGRRQPQLQPADRAARAAGAARPGQGARQVRLPRGGPVRAGRPRARRRRVERDRRRGHAPDRACPSAAARTRACAG